MKRVQYDRYGDPAEMSIGEYTLPPLGSNDVRVAIKSAAINPLDWKIRLGILKLMTGKDFPKGMGSDFAGVVEAIGDKVDNFQVGDEVLGTMDIKKTAAFAETVDTESRYVTKKPSNLSFSQAACLPIPATTAWGAIVDKAKAQKGSRIFVHGCSGAVGRFAVQIARARGAHVSGSCGAASVDSVKAAGIDAVFQYADKASFLSGGKFDAVFDTVGTLDVSDGLSMLKPKGVFVDINPTPGRILRGMISMRYKLVFATKESKHLPEIAKAAGEGKLQSIIGLEAPFSDALSVISDTEAGRRAPGRAVLVFQTARVV